MSTTTITKATIWWISANDGGRTNGPPCGPDYAAPAKFLEHEEAWVTEAWDLLVHRVNGQDISDSWEAEVRFRMPQAPHHWLTSNSEFELYEGRRCVARGRVT